MASKYPVEELAKSHKRFEDFKHESGQMLLPIQGYADLPLLSLEDAVKPIEPFINNIKHQVWIAKNKCKLPYPNGLTHDESAAIVLYTMEWKTENGSVYRVLNDILRTEDREQVKPFYSYLKLILSGLWKLPPVSKMVFRGINFDLTDKYEVNKTYTWWGFSSTTETLAQTKQFLGETGHARTLLNIECLNGKMIKDHSCFSSEREVLLLPALHFEVVSKLSPSPDIHILQLREIVPYCPLLEPPFNSSSLPIQPTTTKSYLSSISPTVPYPSSRSHSPRANGSYNPQSRQTFHERRLNDERQRNRDVALANFQNNQLTDNDLQRVILDELKTNNLWTEIRLSQNKITGRGAQNLCQILENNKTIKRLTIWDNPLTDKGANSFANLLKTNQTLVCLSLGGTQITDNGIIDLARMLKSNETLQELHVDDNEITDRGMIVLAESLKRNVSLQWLDAKQNKISDKSVSALIDMLTENDTMSTLNLDRNGISEKGKNKLQEATNRNRTVKTLLINDQKSCRVQ
ncbi:unnamed protein product [Didymodactylos carnosus]|uniref:NAD(P)(+)--arginine ADP-ribosyltransferase n=1 Tax=Didymodactylos carnosus TaxID=1234261 RepID=A0A814GZC6_9BILA|nr:unnamed protein product [Didymodactylos carnosus]CAF1098894.1 unnamed protein product [Didymodactylos carnosus]CAF3774914.1 unnamed protein product [Didymodactylos carnosus]CAF3860293.1 unnamed protein product [Didymodactylos carnosus]